jgi:glycosyltransferase involved in cell wall biosynthesis
MLQLRHRALYATFDRFPAPKGAAVHIQHMAGTLFTAMGGGLLYVLGDEELPPYQQEPGNIEILRHTAAIPNFLERSLSYGRLLSQLLEQQAAGLQLCHFRDPWSGIPLLTHPQATYKTIYEVNALPSIELPMVYTRLAPRTLAKIRAQEEHCLTNADHIIVPAATTQAKLLSMGVAAERISLLPNGAELPPPTERPPRAPARYLLYFGALQPWQGIETLLRAFALLADFPDLWLVICSSNPPRVAKPYRKLAERLGIAERLLWFFQLSEAELAPWREHALLSLAPLTESPRNLEQGCCPLKILESMASGVPVIASDLPAVRELLRDNIDGMLVQPDRPAAFARAVRILLEYPERIREMGTNARQHVASELRWQQTTTKLAALYQRILEQEA